MSDFLIRQLPYDLSSQAGLALGREVAFLIKWNPRTTPIERIAAQKLAEPTTVWCQPRAGKRLCVWQERLTVATDAQGGVLPVRRIHRLTERTTDRHGQPLLLPEYILEGWTTTLPAHVNSGQVIGLYAEHATHEPFHSEFKTDMDLERLPSGKFDTNYLICQLAAVAMNLLRLIGQHTLHTDFSDVKVGINRKVTDPGISEREDDS